VAMVVVGDPPPEGCVAEQPPLGLVDEEALVGAGMVPSSHAVTRSRSGPALTLD
jgi:hypothetical protein